MHTFSLGGAKVTLSADFLREISDRGKIAGVLSKVAPLTIDMSNLPAGTKLSVYTGAHDMGLVYPPKNEEPNAPELLGEVERGGERMSFTIKPDGVVSVVIDKTPPFLLIKIGDDQKGFYTSEKLAGEVYDVTADTVEKSRDK